MRTLTPLLVLALLLGGCSGTAPTVGSDPVTQPALSSARTVGLGARFRPSPTSPRVARALAVDGMRCGPATRPLAAAHLEAFAAGHVVEIPAGIGFAPPLAKRGAYVRGGRCAYPLRTLEPTGLLLMASTRQRTLGQLFDLWGQPLSASTLAGFTAAAGATVSVFIDGARWPGAARSAPIAAGSQIAVEIGPYVRPHPRYTFPPLSSLGAGA